MSESLVLVERSGATAVLRLNRPDKRNALGRATVAKLGSRLAALVTERESRVIVLASTGSVFCAGLDLDEMNATRLSSGARDQMQHDSRQLAAVFRALSNSPKPTIACVQGPAVAAGAGLVTACDFAIATPNATFGYPEVRRGIVPAIVTPMLLRATSYRAAKYLLLTGNVVEAGDALRMGIYDRIVAEADLADRVQELANMLACGGPATLEATKRWIDRCAAGSDLWVESADASAEARFLPECEEGLRAFQEKRSPSWAPSK